MTTLLAVNCLLFVLVAGYQAFGPRVSADVRKTTPPAAFKSGGARSELVLREISQTLKSIDKRLERMEKRMADFEKTDFEKARKTSGHP